MKFEVFFYTIKAFSIIYIGYIAYTIFIHNRKRHVFVFHCVRSIPQYKLFIKYRNINKPSESIYIIQTTIKSLQSHKMYFLVIHVAGDCGTYGSRHTVQYNFIYIFIQSSFYTSYNFHKL